MALLTAAESSSGVVIEEVGEGSSLEKAGVRPGDLLLAWEREGDQGKIRTVFDWLWMTTEQAPRGTVRLHGQREGAAILFEVPRGVWDARVRPWMAADLLQAYAEGGRRIEAGDIEAGVALWDQLVQRAEPQTTPGLRPWILLQVSEIWSKVRQVDKARAALQAALREAGDAQTRIAILEALGESHELAKELASAEASFRSALETGETAWGESLQVARTSSRLGNVLRQRNRPVEAAQFLNHALEIQQRRAPDSLEVADTLNMLAGVAKVRGELEVMAEHARRALAIQQRWSPDGLPMVRILSTLAIVETQRGLWEKATATLQRALAIQEQRSPDSLQMAGVLNNLGVVARVSGDLDSAVELFHRALEITERLAPEGLQSPPILNNLGAIARERGDLNAAAELFQRALNIWGKVAPEGLGVAGGYRSLGIVAQMRGDLDQAWKLHSLSVEIHERLAPDSHDLAGSLKNLGMVAEARGDLDLALDLLHRARAIDERVTPGTSAEALTLHHLGRLYHRTHRSDQGAQLLARAVDALESQVERLGGSQDLQAEFRAQHKEVYRDAIEVELARGHAAAAFHLVERSRARSFLTLLSERDLEFSGELPAALERSRRDNAARYDQALRQLERWSSASGEAVREALRSELSSLRRQRDEIAAEIRKASPRLAALRQPQPLDLAAARQVLDPGTLALSYSIGKNQTTLFAVRREGGLRVEILEVGEEQLRQEIEDFLKSIQLQEAPTDLARSLYHTLIGPVADLVERSKRVLILPDGPLHRLPFGALVRDQGGREQFLAEWKPLHSALSLTVYGTLRASEGTPSSSAKAVVAFGDPLFSRDTRGEARALILRSPGLRSFGWTALPYSRREVESIAEIYPGARLYLGEEATEERAKTVSREARVLHFSTHGYFDDRTPLDSALVLTIPEDLPPGRDNGLLQVWEIFESVRLDADLVVLSGCKTALGRELSGEGLIGLTRAFQFAGARSVVATHWDVPDQTTAELMARFHHHLAAGLSKDEALRAAQIELIRQPIRITLANEQTIETDASAPYFWAAYQLFGDWR